MVKTKRRSVNKKILVPGLIALLLVASAGLYYFTQRDSNPSTAQTDVGQDVINLDPPTEEDAQRVEDNKQKIIDQEAQANSQPAPQPGTKKPVKPVITYADAGDTSVEVGARVPVFEDGGTCTAIFTSGSNSISRAVQAVKDVNYTACPVMIAANSELGSGSTWSVTVAYNSSIYQGSSDPTTIKVK